MKPFEQITYYLALGALFSHELDAVANHEWRVLPITSFLPDDFAYLLFVAAHVPIFAMILACVASSRERVRYLTEIAVCSILVVHSVIHAAYMGHPDYEFDSGLSNALIFGGGVLGAITLCCQLFRRGNRVT